jgi:hypothetical protein
LFAGVEVVFPAGDAVGLALVPGFFSSLFSAFLLSFAGLLDGDTVEDGLETVTGEVAAGDAAGVVVFGALVSDDGVHAPANAAKAARTVSRISLLIVFSFCGSL